MLKTKYCVCGCGKKLYGMQQKYRGKGCRLRHRTQMLLYGCVPFDSIVILQCPVCDEEYLTYDFEKRHTCHQYTGKNCNQVKSASKKFGRRCKQEKHVHIKKNERMKHLTTLCHPANGISCARYSEGFSFDNIDSGCWGRKHYKKDGSCYSPERMSDFLQYYSKYYTKKTINRTGF